MSQSKRLQELQSLEKQLGQTAQETAQSGDGGFLDGLFKRIGSIGNAVSTTGAALASPFVTGATNMKMNDTLADNRSQNEAIVQKYGFKDWDDYLSTNEDLESSKYDAMFDELKGASAQQTEAVKKIGDDFKNNVVANKIDNTDRYKFAGDAIQTLSTAADVMLPGVMNTPLANGIQGGIEGFAQELSENGEDWSLENALRNATVGSASGAAVGSIGNKLKAPNSLVGSIGRGAELGALGGAFSGGLNAAVNGETNLGNIAEGALRGAGQGAISGAQSGAIMPLVNSAVSKTPGLGKLQQGIQEANADISENGIRGAFKRAAESGDSTVYNNVIEPTINAAKDVASGTGTLVKNGLGINNADQQLLNKPGQNNIQLDETNPLTANTQENLNNKIAGLDTQQQDNTLNYGDSELANQTKRGSLSNNLKRLGESMEGAQANVTRAAARDLGIESTGKTIEGVRKKTGLTNLETQAQFAKELTGGENSLMDNIQRQALSATEDGSVRRVDTTSVERNIDSIVSKYADDNTFGSQKARNQFVDNLQRSINSDGSDVITISNRLKSQASELRGKGIISPSAKDAAAAKIYTDVAKQLDDLSYSAVPQENVNTMFDAAIKEMRGRANQAAQNGNKSIAQAYNTAADSLDNQPRTVQAYRSFKKDFVDASKIDRLTAQAENGAGIKLGQSAKGMLKQGIDTILQKPVQAGLAKAGGALNNVASKIEGNNVGAPGASRSGSFLSDALGIPMTFASPDAINNSWDQTRSIINSSPDVINGNGGTQKAEEELRQEETNLRQQLTDEMSNLESVPDIDIALDGYGSLNLRDVAYAVQKAQADGNQEAYKDLSRVYNSALEEIQAMQQQANEPTVTMLDGRVATMSQIQEGMLQARAYGDTKSYNQLAGMYATMKDIYDAQNKSDETKLNTSEKNQMAKLQTASNAIDELESLYNKAGGGQGVISGNFQNLLGSMGLNSDVATYNSLSSGLINQIGAAIGKTDSLNTEGEVQRALDLVPKLTDNAQTAENKLAALRRLLATNQQSYELAYGIGQ